MSDLTPIRREIVVAADPDLAFRVFTDDIGTWWPLDGFSVHGAESTIALIDRRFVEQHHDHADQVWGTVTEWAPPDALAFTWHPGHGDDNASRVRVTFTANGEGTLVRLEHSGWERFTDPRAAREEYNHGWPAVLKSYAQKAGATDATTWVALLHRPGPAAEGIENLFADPRFRLHAEFLERMHERDYLVAAGPFTGGGGSGGSGRSGGSGMTVLRLPGTAREDEVVELARVDDQAVAIGFLDVDVRPWQVMLTG